MADPFMRHTPGMPRDTSAMKYINILLPQKCTKNREVFILAPSRMPPNPSVLFAKHWDSQYLFILRAHLGHQHSYVVSVPHPGVTGEILEDHHGFVEASNCLHHPEINKPKANKTITKQ